MPSISSKCLVLFRYRVRWYSQPWVMREPLCFRFIESCLLSGMVSLYHGFDERSSRSCPQALARVSFRISFDVGETMEKPKTTFQSGQCLLISRLKRSEKNFAASLRRCWACYLLPQPIPFILLFHWVSMVSLYQKHLKPSHQTQSQHIVSSPERWAEDKSNKGKTVLSF